LSKVGGRRLKLKTQASRRKKSLVINNGRVLKRDGSGDVVKKLGTPERSVLPEKDMAKSAP
jgi:hypothetical protein